jgi:hypothetical protein
MFFRKRREAEQLQQKLLLETLQHLTSQFSDVLQTTQVNHTESLKVIAAANVKVAESLGEQAKSFGNWIESFKVSAQPESRVMNDELMFELEQQKRATLEKEGFPVNGNRGDQLLATMNRFIDMEDLEKSILG